MPPTGPRRLEIWSDGRLYPVIVLPRDSEKRKLEGREVVARQLEARPLGLVDLDRLEVGPDPGEEAFDVGGGRPRLEVVEQRVVEFAGHRKHLQPERAEQIGGQFEVAGGQFDQFAERLVPRVEEQAVDRRGQEGSRVREDIDHVASPDAGAVQAGHVGDRLPGFEVIAVSPDAAYLGNGQSKGTRRDS